MSVQSSRNPFRAQLQSPVQTGLTDTTLPSYHSQAPSPLPDPPNVSPPPSPLHDQPPPYSPTPNFRSGETSVEFGPRRAFEAPPQPPHVIRPQTSAGSHHPLRSRQSHPRFESHPQAVASTFASHHLPRQPRPEPDQRQSYPQTVTSAIGSHHRPPPPRHPLSSDSVSSLPPDHLSESTSDFARDFYAIGEADPPSEHPRNPGSYNSPSSPPPARRPSLSTNVPPSGSSTSSSSRSPSSANDGKPTETPIPGHPLLNHQRVLVYPKGFQCYKCHNTGYKAYDPSSPCRKCWERHAKPYTGAITYAPWASPSPDTNYQKPLPMSRSPIRTTSFSISGQRTTTSITPINPHSLSYQSGTSQPCVRLGPQGNNLVVRPGDPRIGGVVCFKCLGNGTTPFFLFDDTCNACGGVGRVFR